jgi:hypothetical protein
MKSWYVGLILALAVTMLAGCGGQAVSAPADVDSNKAFTNTALDTSYPDALDVSGQLALGMMRLEGTEQAVTPEQAATLLPLWQAIQGRALQSGAETNAVLAQTEGQMASEQLAAITAMQLTQEDVQTWAQEQGLSIGAGSDPGQTGGGQNLSEEKRAERMAQPGGAEGGPPAGLDELSEEEIAALRAAIKTSGMPGTGSGQSPVLLDLLIELLTQRAAEGADQLYTPTPAPTPYPTSTPAPTSSSTRAPTTTAALTATETVAPIDTSMEIAAEAPASLSGQTTSTDTPPTTSGSSPEITRLEDTSPGPPFTTLVSSVVVEEDIYRVMGTVRNDGSETYEGVGIHATFYTLGTSGQGSAGDGMYPHGPVDTYCPCPFLEPGAECPFSLEIYARDYVAYGLHPYGQPVAFFAWHESASVVLSGVAVSNDGVGNVRITGVAVNENEFTLESATIAGSLIDSSGQVVSVGSATVLGGIEPGASAPFDLRIEYEPYARYELYVQGVRY